MLPTRLPLLAIAVGLLLGGLWSRPELAAQEKQVEKKNAQDKDKEEPKKADGADLRTRLQKYEEELFKIRQAMLQECDAELRRLDAAIKQAKGDMDKANQVKDRAAAAKAMQETSKLQMAKFRAGNVRADVERRIQVNKEKPRPVTEHHLGLFLSPVGGALRQQLNLPKDEGLVIDQVLTDSPASRAGLKQFDVVTQFNGQPVKNSVTALRKALAELAPEATVDLVVVRQGKQESIKGLKLPVPKGK